MILFALLLSWSFQAYPTDENILSLLTGKTRVNYLKESSFLRIDQNGYPILKSSVKDKNCYQGEPPVGAVIMATCQEYPSSWGYKGKLKAPQEIHYYDEKGAFFGQQSLEHTAKTDGGDAGAFNFIYVRKKEGATQSVTSCQEKTHWGDTVGNSGNHLSLTSVPACLTLDRSLCQFIQDEFITEGYVFKKGNYYDKIDLWLKRKVTEFWGKELSHKMTERGHLTSALSRSYDAVDDKKKEIKGLRAELYEEKAMKEMLGKFSQMANGNFSEALNQVKVWIKTQKRKYEEKARQGNEEAKGLLPFFADNGLLQHELERFQKMDERSGGLAKLTSNGFRIPIQKKTSDGSIKEGAFILTQGFFVEKIDDLKKQINAVESAIVNHEDSIAQLQAELKEINPYFGEFYASSREVGKKILPNFSKANNVGPSPAFTWNKIDLSLIDLEQGTTPFFSESHLFASCQTVNPHNVAEQIRQEILNDKTGVQSSSKETTSSGASATKI